MVNLLIILKLKLKKALSITCINLSKIIFDPLKPPFLFLRNYLASTIIIDLSANGQQINSPCILIQFFARTTSYPVGNRYDNIYSSVRFIYDKALIAFCCFLLLNSRTPTTGFANPITASN